MGNNRSHRETTYFTQLRLRSGAITAGLCPLSGDGAPQPVWQSHRACGISKNSVSSCFLALFAFPPDAVPRRAPEGNPPDSPDRTVQCFSPGISPYHLLCAIDGSYGIHNPWSVIYSQTDLVEERLVENATRYRRSSSCSRRFSTTDRRNSRNRVKAIRPSIQTQTAEFR
jgi:hypothetical protein